MTRAVKKEVNERYFSLGITASSIEDLIDEFKKQQKALPMDADEYFEIVDACENLQQALDRIYAAQDFLGKLL